MAPLKVRAGRSLLGSPCPGGGSHADPPPNPSPAPTLFALCSTRIYAAHYVSIVAMLGCVEAGIPAVLLAGCVPGVWQGGWTQCHYRWIVQTGPGAGPGELPLVGLQMQGWRRLHGAGEQRRVQGRGTAGPPPCTCAGDGRGGGYPVAAMGGAVTLLHPSTELHAQGLSGEDGGHPSGGVAELMPGQQGHPHSLGPCSSC